MQEVKCDRCGGTFNAEKMIVQEYILAETDTLREQSGGKITTMSKHRNFVPAPVALCGSCSARILKEIAAEKAPRLLKNPERAMDFRDPWPKIMKARPFPVPYSVNRAGCAEDHCGLAGN